MTVQVKSIPQARPERNRSLGARVGNYFNQHALIARQSLLQLWESPLATLMTIAVIGLALSLPALLFVGVINGQSLAAHWQSQGDVTVFLKESMGEADAVEVAEALRAQQGVAEVSLIAPETALGELESLTGFASAVEGLDHNPLPWLVVVALEDKLPEAGIQSVLEAAQSLPRVSMAQFDLDWLSRLHAALGIARTASVVIAFLLSMTVLLVVGNTIRLDIENRRTQIEITRLVGGSDGFVRRPFLYAGLWYGMSGGLLAAGLVIIAVVLLAAPVQTMTDLYGSQFKLSGLGFPGTGILCAAGAAIGLVGAWISVGRHLRMIEPA